MAVSRVASRSPVNKIRLLDVKAASRAEAAANRAAAAANRAVSMVVNRVASMAANRGNRIDRLLST
jgi:hypothetical protein